MTRLNTLITANAVSIPLASGVVQTVVTSPPYYSMREYHGEQGAEWPEVTYHPLEGLPPYHFPGCDPACDHVWGPELPPHHPGQVEQTKWATATAAGAGQTTGRGQYCQLCGGWRGPLGQEPTPEMYIGHLVLIFREVHRVLHPTGTLWLNIGDKHTSQGGSRVYGSSDGETRRGPAVSGSRSPQSGMKAKDLMGIPFRLAFALRADGWWLRADIPWLKANAMPESVKDRPTKAHEYLFLLSKREHYFYDREAILMNHTRPWWREHRGAEYMTREEGRNDGGKPKGKGNPQGRNRRTTDWYDLKAAIQAHEGYIRHLKSVEAHGGMLLDEDGTPLALFANTSSYGAEHYAPFPPELAYPCILGGTSRRGICPLCRSPWERVVEREPVEKTDRSEAYAAASGQGDRPQLFTRRTPKVKTAGWVPSCDCWEKVVREEDLTSPRFSARWLKGNDPEGKITPRPALVMDPFSGTGTVGQACRELPRAPGYVGLDINHGYNRKIGKVRAENTETPEAIETLPLFSSEGA